MQFFGKRSKARWVIDFPCSVDCILRSHWLLKVCSLGRCYPPSCPKLLTTFRACRSPGFDAVSADTLKLIKKRKYHFIKNAFYRTVQPNSKSPIEKK